ncbi:TetR/AcrR family transcriptional regulator [Pantoea cypripedii]|uniref:HTH tetR-type domain-containing protein n=1 Tax=Pantoea cypripedii TaxID=55209 RepID=A0A1X1EYG6_PANCY|nr:TetR/AcrR family transcriptional regulator [Pantoea cypripedii]MBP2195113.1 TetR/AcrR family transcriptional repressor of nem operon [Pantoea cypripedii]ORM94954.1 hypothetical protein HA50_17020 [Pantoea cypripedii]
MSVKNQVLRAGRPREFNVDTAVEDAMLVFWEKGYDGTSLLDLLEGMDITRGSLYKAFGDKKSLFLKSLDQYAERGLQETELALNGQGLVIDSIRSSLLRALKLSQGDSGRLGCFLVATAMEMSSKDDEIACRVRSIFERLQKLYADTIIRGQLSGEINNEKNAHQLARLLVNQIEGMRVLGKVDDSCGDNDKMVELILGVLY